MSSIGLRQFCLSVAGSGCFSRCLGAWVFAGILLGGFPGRAIELFAEDPPAHLAALIEQGCVEFEYYDQREERREFLGQANFQYETPAQYHFDVHYRRRRQEVIATIHPTTTQFDYSVLHRISLPNSYEGQDRWDDVLMLHEFDHVAISSDPRIRLLFEHLLTELPVIQVPIEGREEPSNQWFIEKINEAMAARREAVMQLVRDNYALLDEITLHGVRPIPDRRAFFEALYTKANLDHFAFPHTGEVLDLIRSPEYRDAELNYRWDE